jgi:hypothetical protein
MTRWNYTLTEADMWQLAAIRRIEAAGKLCQGHVEPAPWNDDGKCSVQGVERFSVNGIALGRYCTRHFRALFPDHAPAPVRANFCPNWVGEGVPA